MPEKVFIFDMDGVLIDSEPAYLEMNKKLFIEFGIEMNEENYKALVGLPSLPMWTMLKKKYNLNNDVSEFMNLERRRMIEILDSEKITEPVDGITDLLKLLKVRNIKLSVASSSAKENVNFVLNKLKLSDYFDFVISGEEVVNGKPSPDIFLKVVEVFDAVPEKCYVLEDSKNGIIAANSAGMKSIGFTNNNFNQQDLSKADLIVNNFDSKSISRIINFMNKN